MTTQSSVEPVQLLRKAAWLAQYLPLTTQCSNRETSPPNVHKLRFHEWHSTARRNPGSDERLRGRIHSKFLVTT